MYQKKAVFTIGLLAVNVAVFFFLVFQGRTEDPIFMIEHGAMLTPLVEQGEYYRMISSIFLHFDFSHLMNNMLSLGLLGWQLELTVGKIKYVIIYLCSGIAGNLLSMIMDIRTGEYAVSAGASGAIFGIIGALLYIAVRNHGRIGRISGRGVAWMAVFTLYYGFTSTGVDNYAHIGGLVCGFILAICLYWKKDREYGSFSYR